MHTWWLHTCGYICDVDGSRHHGRHAHRFLRHAAREQMKRNGQGSAGQGQSMRRRQHKLAATSRSARRTTTRHGCNFGGRGSLTTGAEEGQDMRAPDPRDTPICQVNRGKEEDLNKEAQARAQSGQAASRRRGRRAKARHGCNWGRAAPRPVGAARYSGIRVGEATHPGPVLSMPGDGICMFHALASWGGAGPRASPRHDSAACHR